MDVGFADRGMDVISGSYGYEAQLDCCSIDGGGSGNVTGVTGGPYFVSARIRRPCMIDAPVVMLSLYANDNRGESSLDRVVCGFSALVIVDDGPGCARPAVVELPD